MCAEQDRGRLIILVSSGSPLLAVSMSMYFTYPERNHALSWSSLAWLLSIVRIVCWPSTRFGNLASDDHRNPLQWVCPPIDPRRVAINNQ
jgi:hypothetical protein